MARDWLTFFDASALPCCLALHVFMWFWSLGMFPLFLGIIVLIISIFTFVKFMFPNSSYQAITDDDQFRQSVSNIYTKYHRQYDSKDSRRILKYISPSYYMRSRNLRSQEKSILKQYTKSEKLYRHTISTKIWAIFLNPLTIVSWILTRLSIIDRRTAVFVIVLELLMLFMMHNHAQTVANAERQQLIYALETTQSAAINNPVNVDNTAYVNTKAYHDEITSSGLNPETPKWLNKK